MTAVVAGAAAGPADIAAAAATCGLSPIFVVVAGALDQGAQEAHRSFGLVVEYDVDHPDKALSSLRQHRPAGITTFSEGMLPITAELAAGLELPYHDLDTATVLTNKWAQRQRLADTGVDAVRCTLATSRDEVLAALASSSGPVVVKPQRSQSSIDTSCWPSRPGYRPR